VLLGASAFAIDNVKVSGDAKLYYATDDQEYTGTNGQPQSGLFDQASSAGQAALSLGVTADLTKGVSAGAKLYAISTLGLENNLVGNVWESGVKDQYWFGEAWLAATAGKTTGKIGRMELDTPLAFTEKWSIVPNTFEAMVLINQDLPDTTLVGAYVGKGNGSASVPGAGYGSVIGSFENTNMTYVDVNGNGSYDAGEPTGISTEQNGNFGSFYQGAYAAGAINNSFKPLVAQAWYYNVKNVADAFWLQADWDCQLVKDVKVGVQYADMSPKGATQNTLAALDAASPGQKLNADTTGYAAQLAYAGIKDLKLSAAYSDVDSDGYLYLANIASAGQSKLYTEAWWNYTWVSAPGASSYKLAADYDAGFAKLGVQYTDVDVKATGATRSETMTEVALTASKSFGPLDATLAYINTDSNVLNQDPNGITGYDGRSFDTIQAYLTLNF